MRWTSTTAPANDFNSASLYGFVCSAGDARSSEDSEEVRPCSAEGGVCSDGDDGSCPAEADSGAAPMAANVSAKMVDRIMSGSLLRSRSRSTTVRHFTLRPRALSEVPVVRARQRVSFRRRKCRVSVRPTIDRWVSPARAGYAFAETTKRPSSRAQRLRAQGFPRGANVWYRSAV